MDESRLKQLFRQYKKGKVSLNKLCGRIKELPFTDLKFARVDNHRAIRRGFPEVIYAEGKELRQIELIARQILARHNILMLTRADAGTYKYLKKSFPGVKYNAQARIAYLDKGRAKRKLGNVLIVTAGTSDIPVAEEARVTLDLMGNRVRTLYDVGVAGIHRILTEKKELSRAKVIIVVAGMEGALASVVSGLVSRPVIAVPTSVGYGASFKGIAPLLTMLNCCSPGVAVVNIDNGFGAGYLASLINR